MAEPLIRVVDLRRSYALGDVVVHALRGVSLEVAAGSKTHAAALLGISRSQLYTKLKSLGFQDLPAS